MKSISVVLPVFGNSKWLDEAIKSVVEQDNNDWRLVIADDGADQATTTWLKEFMHKWENNQIRWIRRTQNLGLFRNLNRAIEDSNTEWILLLCSDDILHPHAISYLLKLGEEWPETELILSTYDSINHDGSERKASSRLHHDQLSLDTGLIQPEQMVPGLLRLGSLNGNLTGMAFSKKLWKEIGPFRENWRHAGDWEWLIRASERKAILLNRLPIASVRTHDQQLSVSNRHSGHECVEVAAVVGSLLKHPQLMNEPKRSQWAGHVMQYQLWNLIKYPSQWKWSQLQESLIAIHKSAGLRQTGWSLLRWLPKRWLQRISLSKH